jgi:hypothetical protein
VARALSHCRRTSTQEVGLLGMLLIVLGKAMETNATSRTPISGEVDLPTRLEQTTVMEELD